MVSSFTIQLHHKRHPNFTHLWSPNQFESINPPYKGEVTFDGAEYVVHFTIGTPPRKTFAVFDTGSPFFWLQSSSCRKCMRQPYDLNRSSTLELVRCSDPDCGGIEASGVGRCESTETRDPHWRHCIYHVDLSSTVIDQIRVDMWLQVRLVIGVGTENHEPFRGDLELNSAPGVFGMSIAAIYQLQYKFEVTRFSYCIPIDTNKPRTYVKFGRAAEFTGPLEKLIDDRDMYKLSLTAVSVNGKLLNNFGTYGSWKDFSMILDTGTPVSRIDPDVMGALRYELEALFGEGHTLRDQGGLDVCWDDGLVTADNERVKNMTITFHFGDIAFELSQPQLWIKMQGMYCFLFLEEDLVLERSQSSVLCRAPTNI